MLIFIENTPRTYAWGSHDALPELLGVSPTGEPQAELWLGDHPGAPASVAKARPEPQTLIDLIESDPERYGVDGQHLPFLLKVLAIGAPLSLQVHPDKAQAEAGFAREEASGLARNARERNYGDPNHKPELLVALSEVSALCGFRALGEAQADLRALKRAALDGAGREALAHAARLCSAADEDQAQQARREFLVWALRLDGAMQAGTDSEGENAPEASDAVRAIADAVDPANEKELQISADRLRALRDLTAAYPADPGVLISVLLNLITLQPGEAVYLGARHLHAYLSGVAVEVMAASDNVLRAGMTEKHIDAAELLHITDTATLDEPRLRPRALAAGLVAWQPGVPDFELMRARLTDAEPDAAHDGIGAVNSASSASIFKAVNTFNASGAVRGDTRGLLDSWAESVQVECEYPTVIVAVEGRVRVERVGGEFSEVASVGRGQSLYVSAGEPIELRGKGQVFLATVGNDWPSVSQLSSEG